MWAIPSKNSYYIKMLTGQKTGLTQVKKKNQGIDVQHFNKTEMQKCRDDNVLSTTVVIPHLMCFRLAWPRCTTWSSHTKPAAFSENVIFNASLFHSYPSLKEWGIVLSKPIKTQPKLTAGVQFKVSPTYSPSFNKTFYHAVSLAGAAKEKQQEQPR